jgi:hypothetical protein
MVDYYLLPTTEMSYPKAVEERNPQKNYANCFHMDFCKILAAPRPIELVIK